MVKLTEEQKEIRELKRQINNLNTELIDMNIIFQVKKKIVSYQENMINKLLNTIQNKKLEVETDLERGY